MTPLSLADINAIMTTICCVLTAIVVPCLGYIIKQWRINKKRKNIVDSMPEQLESIQNDLNTIKHKQQQTDLDSKTYREKMESKFDKLETQQLKYIINDTFSTCGGDLTLVSHERLINATECAYIYIEKGLNHETGARCKLLFEEVERRALNIRQEEGL